MQFTVLSWNIHGKRYITKTNFRKIAPILQAQPTDIVCLQEAHEARTELRFLDPFHGFHHVVPEQGFNQNIIMSRFPVRAGGDLHFPPLSPKRLESALWADIEVGESLLRVYNCHFGVVAAGPSVRALQLEFILDHAEAHSGPVMVCGDFNTTIPKEGLPRVMTQLFHLQAPRTIHVKGVKFSGDERYAFVKLAEQRGYREVADIAESTWRAAPLQWEPFKLKLDWMLVRDIHTPKVTLRPYVSDHKAIHAECSLI